MVAIFYVSSREHAPLPATVSDKYAHALAYAGLAVTVVRAAAGGLPAGVSKSTAALSLVIVAAYGATDEWHQTFVRGRTADAMDVAADAIGACIGVAAYWAWGILSIRARLRGFMP